MRALWEVSSRFRDIARAVSRVGRGTGETPRPGDQETGRKLLVRETSSVPQPGGFEGFVPISEGLFSHHPPVLDREVHSDGSIVRRIWGIFVLLFGVAQAGDGPSR
jgi:hypothetical protein